MIRWLAHHLLLALAALAILAGALLAAAAIVRRTVGSAELARTASELLTEQLDPATTRLRIADISGNPLTGIVLHEVALEVRQAPGGAAAIPAVDSPWQAFLATSEVRVSYAPLEILRRRPRIREVQLVSPTIVLPAAGEAWPGLRKGRGAPSRTDGLGLSIDHLVMIDATLTRDSVPTAGNEGATPASGGTHGGPTVHFTLGTGFEIGREFVAVDIDSLRARLADRPPINAAGRIEVRGSGVYFDHLELRSGLSHALLGGGLDGLRGARVRVELDSLVWADLEAALSTTLFGHPGWIRGTVTLDGEWVDLRYAFTGEARVGEARLDGLAISGVADPRAIAIDKLAFRIDEVPFNGSGRIGLGTERARSAARLSFGEVDFKNFPFLRDLAWLPRGRLAGAVDVAGETRGPEGPRRPFTLDVVRGEVAGFVIAPGRFRGGLGRDGVIDLEEYAVTTRGAVITGSGRIDPRGELALIQDLTITDLAALGGMVGENRFGGRGMLHLTLSGPVRAPGFAAEGDLDSLAAGPFLLRSVQVHVENGTARPQFAFDLAATAGRGKLGGLGLDSLAVDFSYSSGAIQARHFQMVRAQSEVHGSGHIEFLAGATLFDADTVGLRIGDLRFTATEPVRAERRGSLWVIDDVALVGAGGELGARGTIDAAGRDTEFTLEAHRLDLAAFGAALGGGAAPAGVLDLRLVAGGGGPDFNLDVALKSDSLRVGAFAAAGLSIAATLTRDAIRLDPIRFHRGGQIEVNGEIRLATELTGFRNLPRLFQKATLARASVDLAVSAPQLDLESWHGLHSTIDQCAGSIALNAEITGAMSAPDGTLEIRSDRFVLAGRAFAPAVASAQLMSGQVVLSTSRFGVAEMPFSVRGATPLHLRLDAPPALDRDGPIDLVADLDGASLALAAYLSRSIAEAEGVIDGQIRVAGSLNAPSFFGTVVIKDGRIVIGGREEAIEDLTARLELTGQRIEFVDLEATDGARGRLRATGVLDVTGARLAGYDMSVRLREYEVGMTGDYLATIDGALTLRKGEVAGLTGLPEYGGRISVRRLDYVREVVGGRSVGEPGPSSWIGRFEIELPRNAWIRNNDLEVELKGELTYERDVAGRIILGDLETIRGRYDLVGHTFRITSGEILFTDPEVIDPEINVSAETRIPEARIFATITGRASDRQVTLTSEPDYDQATLWRFLVPTDAEQVTSMALTPFMRDLERSLSRQIPGLSVRVEARTLEEGAEPTWGARVGTYVAPELFLSAYQGFSSGSAQDLSVEYELSRIAYLKGSVLRSGLTESRSSQDVDQDYSIDLNLRWEF